jgi:hypothetical protein
VIDLEFEQKAADVVEGLYCTIKPDEVPPIPQNKFLQRIDPSEVSHVAHNDKTIEKKDKQAIENEDNWMMSRRYTFE